MNNYERITMAINRINSKGWTPGQMEDQIGRGCLIRSLIADGEFGGSMYGSSGQEEVEAACQVLGFTDSHAAIEWNDARIEKVIIMSDLEMMYAQWRAEPNTLISRNERSKTTMVRQRTYLRTKAEVLARLEAARDSLIHQEIDRAVHAEAKVATSQATVSCQLVEA